LHDFPAPRLPRSPERNRGVKATAAPSGKYVMKDPQLQGEIERCRRELADVESKLRAGHPEVEGLSLALRDWSTELRILKGTHADSA
jgi:hypothetical protein